MTLIVDQLAVGPMENFSYIVGNPASGELAVIDMGWEPDAILAHAANRHCRIGAILLTHGHYDHVQAVSELLKKMPIPAPVYIHTNETYSLDPSIEITPIQEGTAIRMNGVVFDCLETPGHSPAAICFKMENHLFTGDTLFIGGCGRADLPGSDPIKLYESLQRLARLPDETIVYSGHDYGSMPTSTIGVEKKTNPYMQASSLEVFKRMRMGE